MELILGGRTSGKSEMLKRRIEPADQRGESFVIVVPNIAMTESYIRAFGKHHVATISQVVNDHYLDGISRDVSVYVDNLNLMLHELFGVHYPSIATMNIDEPMVVLPSRRT